MEGVALELDRNQADRCYRFKTPEGMFLDVDYPSGGSLIIPDVNVKVAAEEKRAEVPGSILDGRDSQTYRLDLEGDGTYSIRVEKGGFYFFAGQGGDVKMGSYAKRSRFQVIASKGNIGSVLPGEQVILRLNDANHPFNGKYLTRNAENNVRIGVIRGRIQWTMMDEGKCELK
jgi:hypothetical protein